MDNPSQAESKDSCGCNEQAVTHPSGMKRCSGLKSNFKISTVLKKQEKNSILHAVCVGDGYLRLPSPFKNWNPKNYQLSIQHCIEQLDFLKWKRDLLEKCLDKKINIKIYERKDKAWCNGKWDNSKIRERKVCTLTVSDAKFNKVYRRLYKNKKKILSKKFLNRINEMALAIWFGDDGWGGIITSKRYGKIYPNKKYKRINLSTQCFSKEDVDKLIQYFKDKWNINSYQYNEVIYIQQQKSVEKFLELVSPYLRNIKSMKHKLCGC